MQKNTIQQDKSKDNLYNNLLLQLKGLIADETDILANLANAAALIFTSLDNVNWAGFYRVVEQELILGPFQGKPACIRIPLTKGVCGHALKYKKTVRVDDVRLFSGHIPCDSSTLSEIVIPLVQNEKVIAVLDIDSPIINRFDEEDKKGLEAVVELLQSQLKDGHSFWKMPA